MGREKSSHLFHLFGSNASFFGGLGVYLSIHISVLVVVFFLEDCFLVIVVEEDDSLDFLLLLD